MKRLDQYLVEAGLAETRNKAQNIIKEGLVSVDGIVMLKSSFKVDGGESIVKVKEHKDYVSRAAFKLAAFLDEIAINIEGANVLDIGSSTGGFTQVLLENRAFHVSCVDVGRDQLHRSLREDARVSVYEDRDIREFQTVERFDLVTSDVSFISLLHILDDIDRLSSDKIILLFKPQFEVGREAKRDKNGVVTDEKIIQKAMIHFEDACVIKGWNLVVKSPSKITGKEGNLEYCYYYKKQ
ncbi:TlyA family RNA methyltransferase [Sulfurimonas sp. HSL-1716]|uniref:23S rRNA (cytidine-2'-O)-methyltransferase TlyA n=1 Tax=Hydrocurvibacter sulfurireducens TaxID=3131937 RepID=UPI0031F988B4